MLKYSHSFVERRQSVFNLQQFETILILFFFFLLLIFQISLYGKHSKSINLLASLAVEWQSFIYPMGVSRD